MLLQMELQVYKKIITILIVLVATNVSLFSQCLCAFVKFTIVLEDLYFTSDSSNYSIETTIMYPGNPSEYSRRITKKSHLEKDTLFFQFPTGGGINTLQFLIKNHTAETEMVITVLNMRYDNPYFIDLGRFTQGSYLFDWRKINQCQGQNPLDNIVDCENMKFYQLQLKDDAGSSFNHNKIKPFCLEYFKIE